MDPTMNSPRPLSFALGDIDGNFRNVEAGRLWEFVAHRKVCFWQVPAARQKQPAVQT